MKYEKIFFLSFFLSFFLLEINCLNVNNVKNHLKSNKKKYISVLLIPALTYLLKKTYDLTDNLENKVKNNLKFEPLTSDIYQEIKQALDERIKKSKDDENKRIDDENKRIEKSNHDFYTSFKLNIAQNNLNNCQKKNDINDLIINQKEEKVYEDKQDKNNIYKNINKLNNEAEAIKGCFFNEQDNEQIIENQNKQIKQEEYIIKKNNQKNQQEEQVDQEDQGDKNELIDFNNFLSEEEYLKVIKKFNKYGISIILDKLEKDFKNENITNLLNNEYKINYINKVSEHKDYEYADGYLKFYNEQEKNEINSLLSKLKLELKQNINISCEECKKSINWRDLNSYFKSLEDKIDKLNKSLSINDFCCNDKNNCENKNYRLFINNFEEKLKNFKEKFELRYLNEYKENVKNKIEEFLKKDKNNENFLINFIKDYGYLCYLSFLETYSDKKLKEEYKILELKEKKILKIKEILNEIPNFSLHFVLKRVVDLISKNINCPDNYANAETMILVEKEKQQEKQQKNQLEDEDELDPNLDWVKEIQNVPFFILNKENEGFEFLADIHDSMIPIHKIFSYNEKFDQNKNIEIWLGDYIHRGNSNIQSIGNLLSVSFVQLYLNNKFKFIRGNHESKTLMTDIRNGASTYEEKLFSLNNTNDLLSKIFPAGIIVNNELLGIHGYFCDTFSKDTEELLKNSNNNKKMNEIIYANITPNECTKDYYNDNYRYGENKIIASNLCDLSTNKNPNSMRYSCDYDFHFNLHKKYFTFFKKCLHGHENGNDLQWEYFRNKGVINNNIERIKRDSNGYELNVHAYTYNNIPEFDETKEMHKKYKDSCFFLPLCNNGNTYCCHWCKKNKECKNNKQKIYWTLIKKNENKVNDFFGKFVDFNKITKYEF